MLSYVYDEKVAGGADVFLQHCEPCTHFSCATNCFQNRAFSPRASALTTDMASCKKKVNAVTKRVNFQALLQGGGQEASGAGMAALKVGECEGFLLPLLNTFFHTFACKHASMR